MASVPAFSRTGGKSACAGRAVGPSGTVLYLSMVAGSPSHAAGRPPCYAAVGSRFPVKWSINRVRAFRDAVESAGAKCLVFPGGHHDDGESPDGFIERLSRWLADLPDRCAVFAVSDEVAVQVVRAARLVRQSPSHLEVEGDAGVAFG